MPGVDSAAASGSQVCTGHIGALMANAAKKPRNSAFWMPLLIVQVGQRPEVEGPRVATLARDDVEADEAASMSRPPKRL